MIYSGKIPWIQPVEGVEVKQEGKEGGGLMQWNAENLTTYQVATYHSTNEKQMHILGYVSYEGLGLGELLPHLQKAQVVQWHLPVSFLNTKENVVYAPPQFISLSPPLPSLLLSSHKLKSHSDLFL